MSTNHILHRLLNGIVVKKHVLFLVLLTLVMLSTSSGSLAYNVYYGQLHSHSNNSDGSGSPDTAYQYARDTAGLDFFSLADHCSYPYNTNPPGLSDSEYNNQKSVADSYNEDGVYTTFWGFEWTSDDTSWGGPDTLLGKGHITIINSPDHCDADDEATNDLNELVAWMSTRDCVAFFNHPGEYGYPDYFDHFDFNHTDKIVGMELWNRNTDYYSKIDSAAGKRWYDEALDKDWYIGATGSQDNHSANWGTMNEWRMAILAPALTRADLYAAMQARRFYSTRDKNLVLSFTCNGAQMGSRIGIFDGSLNVVIEASDGDNEVFSKIELLKNGSVIQTWTPNSTNPSVSTTVTGAQGDYFYVKVEQSGESGWRAISSPIFITSNSSDVTPPTPDPMTWAQVPVPGGLDPVVVTDKQENTNEMYFAGNVSNADLIEGTMPSSSQGPWESDGTGGPEILTNGIYGNAGELAQVLWDVNDSDGSFVEYTLGAGDNGLGYDITSIRTFSAWGRANLHEQHYKIFLKKVGEPFAELTEVHFQPTLGDAGATQVTLTADAGILASGVEAIRFEFLEITAVSPGGPTHGATYREFDIEGVPTLTDPLASHATSISMIATSANDITGVEYYFECTAGGGNDSGWQDIPSYTDTGLSPCTQYTYRVRARDKSPAQNTTGFSATASATTTSDNPGDVTGDCAVDCGDLFVMARDWLQSGSVADIYPSPYGDDIVNLLDLAVLARHWLEGVTP
jgi:hypothetical protein